MIFILCPHCNKKIGITQGTFNKCIYCNKETRCGQCREVIDTTREVLFGTFACSARCQIVLCDALDGCSYKELNDLFIALGTMNKEDFEKECNQRMIKP